MAEIEKRRLKCTPEIVAAICRHVLAGASMRSAAGSVGITYTTLKRWQAWQREGKEPYASLCAPLKRARAEAIVNAERRVYEGKAGWQASARWLESIEPRTWRRTERREIAQATDIRIRWPDLAAAKPEAMLRSRQVLLDALGKN